MEMDEVTSEVAKVQKLAKNYPDLAQRLIGIGIESYTVEVASGIMLYRHASGKHGIKYPETPIRPIAAAFSSELTVKAVRDNQQGRSDFPGFMKDIAAAGVRFYEATLTGTKRVTYIGSGGSYVEEIPI